MGQGDPNYTCTERLLRVRKGVGARPKQVLLMLPQNLALESVLAKRLTCTGMQALSLGRCEKESKKTGQRKTKTQKNCPIEVT